VSQVVGQWVFQSTTNHIATHCNVSSSFSVRLSTFFVKPWEPTNHTERPQAFVVNVISAFAQLESKHRSTSRPAGTLRYGILAVAHDEGETATEVVKSFRGFNL